MGKSRDEWQGRVRLGMAAGGMRAGVPRQVTPEEGMA